MRQSITQEFDYGCGIACYAFVHNSTYQEAEKQLGEEQAKSTRFLIKDFVAALNNSNKPYISKHVKAPTKKLIYAEGVIVLIRRSKRYPSGHYLIRHNDTWMDPRINLPYNKNIKHAQSGFRKRLPGAPMYALLPMENKKILVY